MSIPKLFFFRFDVVGSCGGFTEYYPIKVFFIYKVLLACHKARELTGYAHLAHSERS